MTGILSLPPEILHEIIEICTQQQRCGLRATCKVLNEIADPIVFRRLRLAADESSDSSRITENQIIALVTRSSKACEFAREMEIKYIFHELDASEQSLPHFGYCDDLRACLPIAVSQLRNVIRFRWPISCSEFNPEWLVNWLLQTVAHLPKLTELDVCSVETGVSLTPPVGLFSNLSTLSVSGDYEGHLPSFISQVSTAIANSPQLRSLTVCYFGLPDDSPLPTLGDFFAKTSTKNPLRLEHLSIDCIDATITQTSLPHLMHLSSFGFSCRYFDFSVALSVWTSFLLSNIKLSDVRIEEIITEETMLYLSSFSGLKRLVVNYDADSDDETIGNMLFAMVLPKHVDSLQTLQIGSVDYDEWAFDLDTSKSIIKCHKLRELEIAMESSMPMQVLLDTVAHLPELNFLHIFTHMVDEKGAELADFEPCQGLRYVKELKIGSVDFVLEKDDDKSVRYRKIALVSG